MIVVNEDDVDFILDNGVDIDNDGDFEDDFGDEDDGDGVVVDVDCDLIGEVVVVCCDDNGILFDFIDDIFYVDFSIIGFGVGISVGWIVIVDGVLVGGGDYSGVIVIVGLFLISGGDVLLYVIDVNDIGCCVILRVDVLEFCLLLLCDLEVVLIVVDCDDNGIGFDLLDDVYFVFFNVIGSNNEFWSVMVDGEIVFSGEYYN